MESVRERTFLKLLEVLGQLLQPSLNVCHF